MPGAQAHGDFLRQAFDASDDLIVVIDTYTGAIVDCNLSLCEALGYERHEMLRLHAYDFNPALSPEFFATMRERLRWPHPKLVFRPQYRRKDGSTFPVELRAHASEIEGRRLSIGIARDITAQMALEEALHSSKRQYESLLRNLPGVVYRCALIDGAVLWVGDGIEGLTGCTAAELVRGGKSLDGFLLPGDREDRRQAWELSANEGGDFDLTVTFTARSGRQRIVRDVGHVFAGPDGSLIVEGILFDATDRMERERVLREAFVAEHRRFEQIVVASRQVVYEQDMQTGRLVFSGTTLSEVFGYTNDSHGTSGEAWREKLHPDDRDRVLAMTDKVIDSRMIDVEYRYRHADGSYRWVWDRGVCEAGPDGAILKVVGMMQDITSRKELEAQISAARRMDTVGSLAGGVAHDVNNYLTTILGNIDVALMRLGDDEEWPELQDAREAAVGCASLVRNLLMFARQHEAVRTCLEPQEIVQGMCRMLSRLAGPDVDLRFEIDPSAPSFMADRVQVQQVLMNLVVNARDAMKGCGSVMVRAAPARRPDTTGGRKRMFTKFTVTDSGPGVSAQVRDRIFDPFFTTRDVGEGMGLGLSIVHGVARSHGGWVELEPDAGAGATFSVYFPADD